MDELLEQFLIEGRDLTADAHRAVSELERDRGDHAAIDSLFRAIHTLKGSVALFEMGPAEHALHSAETLLARLRKDTAPPNSEELSALLAIVDQVDRWIDEIETSGTLAEVAGDVSRELIAALGNDQERAASGDASQAAWLPELIARPQFVGKLPPAGGTAFRYAPDPECFFRGDDPLATVAAIPELLAFAILPAGEWPDLAAIDPFRCISVVEGISSADLDAVSAAFRLVPDQVALSPVGRVTGLPKNAQGNDGSAVLRVEGRKLDRLARQAGEMTIAVHSLDSLVERAERIDRSFAADLKRAQAAIESVSSRLRTSIADVRLVSLGPVLRRLPRLAREVAAAVGKEIDFNISGETTEADKQIADALFEPLLHLVRNAIDHGIEPSETREAAGKPSRGRVNLVVAPQGDRLIVSLTDDGRGIDPQHLRSAAVTKGLIDEEASAGLTDAQALRLVFAPGFSTAKTVSDVSGRGVGMDAVRTAVERLQGTIEIESVVGAGTTLRISLPLNAITTRLLTVSAGGVLYGLRLDQVTETMRIDAREIRAVGQGEACVVRNRTVPVVDLGTLLGRPREKSPTARLVLTEATGELIAVRVDALGDRLDAMVRERSGLLASVPVIGGTAVLGDGGVLLVLDLPELVS